MTDEVKNSTGPYGLLWNYLTPGKDRSENFGAGNWYTTKMREHPAVKRARIEAEGQVAIDCYQSCNSKAASAISYDLGKKSFWNQTSDFLRSIVEFASFGLVGKDPAFGVIGSFGSKSHWQAGQVNCAQGQADISMHVENQMGAASMTRYGYKNSDQTLLSNNPFGDEQPLATVRQSWD